MSPLTNRAPFEPSDLFDPRAEVRARACSIAPVDRDTSFHLRAVLLFDRAVAPRVAAAEAFARFADPAVGGHLVDALRDPSPLVRDAVVRALAKNGAVDSAPAIAELATSDERWFVRRTAVFAYAALAGFSATTVLLTALEDPFWRVRHAAVLALEALGQSHDDTRARVLAEPLDTPAARRAIEFLRARWAMVTPSLDIARDHETFENDPWYDDDPAVMTARVAQNPPPPERLVAMLGESHEPLRKLAIRGLVRGRDRIALAGAACWLDAPRVPHAAESARRVLRLAHEDNIAVAVAAVESKLPGVAAWAIRAATDAHQTQLAPAVLARSNDPDARVRSAVAYAAPSFADSPEHAARIVAPMVDDKDSAVRESAIAALRSIRHPLASQALARVDRRSASVPSRVALVGAAVDREDVATLRELLADPHPFVRGAAVDALRTVGALGEHERVALTNDRDPWVRAAAIEADDASMVLEREPDVTVRRIAIDRVCAARRELDPEFVLAVGLAASADRDAWIRARAARLLAPETDDASLVALLACEADTSPMVRAAAADTLERSSTIAATVTNAIDRGLVPPRSLGVALGWIARASDAPAATLERLAKDPTMKATVAAVSLVLPERDRARVQLVSGAPAIEERAPRERRDYAPFPDALHRPFGKTSLSLAPIAFSGAQIPPESVFIEGRERGMNAFFWEPRYVSLTRFVRKSPKKSDIHIIAGTYHADRASIVSDVERALRVLKVDQLGVFLLYWARSAARLDSEAFETLETLKQQGKIAAHGFSTHLRSLAIGALAERRWDVVMSRYNAAHTGAERELWPAVQRANAGAIAFTALCYTRLLAPVHGSNTAPISAADCYRFALANPAVGLVLAAPSIGRDARAAFDAMERPALDPDRERAIRAHGAAVYRVDTEFNALVRKGDRIVLADPREAALSLMDAARAE
ncbi:MAG: HEAT repeat domain-containing protein [Myxococcales bacterium]|nr:HEAT repeat domain-containing protein [Myxococcales bacterium]